MATAATHDWNDQGEIYLADEDGWKEEAKAVISDVTDHVKLIQIADGLKVRCVIVMDGLTVCCKR